MGGAIFPTFCSSMIENDPLRNQIASQGVPSYYLVVIVAGRHSLARCCACAS
jgi:hypothetical protein